MLYQDITHISIKICMNVPDSYNTPMPDHNTHVILDKVAATIVFLTTELEKNEGLF